MLSGDEEVLLSGDPNTLQAKVKFRQPPMLSDLEALLTVVEEESAEYDLFRVCSVFHSAYFQLRPSGLVYTIGELLFLLFSRPASPN